MSRLIELLLLGGLVGLSGCSSSLNTWGSNVPMGEGKYPEVPVEHVMILFDPPKREYVQIGIVSSIGSLVASDGDMFRKLQKEAAAMGADAIIFRAETQSPGNSSIYPKRNAIAIKYK